MGTITLKTVAHELIGSPQARLIYRQADRNAADITYHNRLHGMRVRNRAVGLATRIEKLFPGTFRQEHLDFHIPVAAFGHDFGRSRPTPVIAGKPVDRSGYYSSIILREMLSQRDISRRDQLLVMYAVANHSAGPSRKALDVREGDTAWRREKQLVLSPLVLADKGDSTRVRVRPYEVRTIESLRANWSGRRDGSWYFNEVADENWRNWLACYAIRRSTDTIDLTENGGDSRFKGSIIRVWDLDTAVCTADQILSVGWFAKGNHGCEKAARIFGLNYGIEANGKRWFWDSEKMLWALRQAAA